MHWFFSCSGVRKHINILVLWLYAGLGKFVKLSNITSVKLLRCGSISYLGPCYICTEVLKLRLHIAINFVSWWMWFSGSTTKVQGSFSHECILLPSYVPLYFCGRTIKYHAVKCVNVILLEGSWRHYGLILDYQNTISIHRKYIYVGGS